MKKIIIAEEDATWIISQLYLLLEGENGKKNLQIINKIKKQFSQYNEE